MSYFILLLIGSLLLAIISLIKILKQQNRDVFKLFDNELYQNTNRLEERNRNILEDSDIDLDSMKSLFLVAKYWKIENFDVNYLASIAGVDSQGVSLLGLSKAAKSLGFDVQNVRFKIDNKQDWIEFTKVLPPWIAHYREEYFIVVYKVTKSEILIQFPWEEKKCISHREFINNWNGIALLLWPKK